MLYTVRVAAAVERDLSDIYDYIATASSAAQAERVLDRLRDDVLSLAKSPNRGSWPPELLALGLRDFRQLVSRPYRIFYRVSEQQVMVLLIADTRRDMLPLLERRLLSR
jgi:toxin ParE1/3/4